MKSYFVAGALLVLVNLFQPIIPVSVAPITVITLTAILYRFYRLSDRRQCVVRYYRNSDDVAAVYGPLSEEETFLLLGKLHQLFPMAVTDVFTLSSDDTQ